MLRVHQLSLAIDPKEPPTSITINEGGGGLRHPAVRFIKNRLEVAFAGCLSDIRESFRPFYLNLSWRFVKQRYSEKLHFCKADHNRFCLFHFCDAIGSGRRKEVWD